jgi:putative ABC transport system permease protein
MQAAMNRNFEKAFVGADALGGFDVRVNVNGNNRLPDLKQTLTAAPADPRRADPATISAAGEARIAYPFEVDVEDPEWPKRDPAARKEEDRFKHVTLFGVDAAFVQAQRIPLKHRAAGYATDDAVWGAVHGSAGFAVIPSSINSGNRAFGPPGAEDLLSLPVDYTKDGFAPFTLNLRNRTTGAITPIVVIGQMKDSADLFWSGTIVEKGIVERTFPEAKAQSFFLKLKDGADARAYAKQVEATLVQASADSLDKLVSDAQAQNRTFLEMFQGFLALGLLVGIAALGVISLRAVVERRQQIGMLRAIGYRRSMVQLSFLLESGFIALSGIGLGLGLGLSFAANLFTSGEFGASTKGIEFTIPWAQVGLMTGFAFVASLITTYFPARAASHVPVAEALRYE